jgi:hypothetical protein
MSFDIRGDDRLRMVEVLHKYAENTADRRALRRCMGVPEGDDLTGTAGDRKVIYPNHAAAVACAAELLQVFGTRMWPYKCPRAKRHHHLTSRGDKAGDTCGCGEAI